MLAAPILEALLCSAFAAGGAGGADGAGFVALLRRAGLPREAAAEVRRQDKLDGAPDESGDQLVDLGLELAAAGELAPAIEMLDMAVGRTDDAALGDDRRLVLGTLLLKQGSYPSAQRTFEKVLAFSSDAPARARAERLACIGSLWGLDPEPARACVPRLLPGSLSPQARRRVDHDLDTLAASDSWRGWVGGTLSVVLPGLGQLTSGEPLDALLALLVNGGGGVGAVAIAIGGDLVDAIVLALAVVSRYYWGNVEHGADDWKAVGEHRKRRAADRLMRLLVSPTSGL
jgi:tetratricopeptide (TPR) repeat protein